MQKGLEKCRTYYETYGKPLLSEFPGLQGHFAAGLVGEGSECFGFDDAVSTDHDYFPRFFIWLDGEGYEKYGAVLQEAYLKLPDKFEGFPDTVMTQEASFRCGVCKTTDFYYRLLGRQMPPETMYDWISLQETRLAAVTNGEVFEDNGGGFMEQRRAYLSYFPEDVRKKKLASRLRKMAQMGQYNYARCMQRGEAAAAQMALSEFIQNTCSCVYLLNKAYMPYLKWSCKGIERLEHLSELREQLEMLALLPPQQDKWDRMVLEKYRFHLNFTDEKVVLIEKIALSVAEELKRQGLSESSDAYLEQHAAEVEDRIEDEVLRLASLM